MNPTRFDYHAPTPFGDAHLSLPATASVEAPSAISAALALAIADALLSQVDAWLAPVASGGLDWQWPAAEAPADSPQMALATWDIVQGSAAGEARLALPWPLIRHAGRPAAPLDTALHWQAAPACVVVDRFDLDDEEIACLEPGGAVMLPGSFEQPGLAWLRALGETSSANGLAVELAGDPCLPEAICGASALPEGRWLAQRASLNPVPLPQACGWLPFDTPLELSPTVELWQLAGTAEGETPVLRAQGRLAPWGQGQAVLLTTVSPGAA